MGRYVTTVGSSTVVLIEDTPDVIRQSVQGSILQGTNIATDLLNTVTNTYAHKVRAAYNYARDRYYLGLPEGTFGRISVNEVDVIEALNQVHTLSDPANKIQLISAGIDSFNAVSLTNYTLQDGLLVDGFLVTYDPDTDIITDQVGSNFTYMGYTHLSPTSLSTRWYVSGHGGTADLTINVSSNTYFKFYRDKFYYYVKYLEVEPDGTPVGKTKYWCYQEDLDLFPKLNLDNQKVEVNQYMPIIPLRIANDTLYNAPEEKQGQDYKTSKVLLNRLGLDIDDLTKAIDENPDINSVDHAYVILGVNLYSNKPQALKYIYEFMKYIFARAQGDSYISIKDGTYNVRLVWDSISFRTYTGSIGKVGSITKQVLSKSNGFITDDFIQLRYQATPTVVHEYDWFNVALFNYIYQTGEAVITALDAHTIEDEALCIPLNISIIENKLSPLEANTVYYDSLRIVFNAFDRKKLKWYQTGIFKFVFAVVAIAISVVTAGVGAALIGIVVGLGINLALELLTKLTIMVFGEEVGAIFATLSAIATVVVAFSLGIIPDVTSLIALGVTVTTGIAGIYTQDIAEQLQQEFQELSSSYETKNESLEAAKDKLDTSKLDPMNIFGSVGMLPNQSISDYYYTKLELPIKSGETSIDLIHSWFDTQLTLPKLH